MEVYNILQLWQKSYWEEARAASCPIHVGKDMRPTCRGSTESYSVLELKRFLVLVNRSIYDFLQIYLAMLLKNHGFL